MLHRNVYFSPADAPAGAPPATQTPPAQTPPAGPEFFIKPDGSYIANFWEHPAFPEDLRENVQIRTHKTIGDTYKNWSTLERIRGNDVVPIPGPNADPAIVDQTLWGRLGWPDSPDKYELPKIEDAGLSKQHEAPEAQRNAFLAAAHAGRLTQWQLNTMLGHWNKSVADSVKAAAAARAETLVPLRTAWGNAFEANTEAALSVARSKLAPEDFERLQAAGLLDDPAVRKLLFDVHEMTREGEPSLDTPVPADVAAQAETKLREMQADVNGPLYNDQHPLHAQTRKDFERLRELVNKAREARGG